MTKLIFLHGAPASGKLTVAKALLRAIPGRLFDNHAAIDLARTLFEFGDPGFWELVSTVWLAALREAVARDVPLVVTTFCYSDPEDRAFVEQVDEIVVRRGGRLLPVFLRCSAEEAKRRVGAAERAARGKIASPEAWAEIAARWTIVPMPRADCLMLDTDVETPDAVARRIVRHFALA